METKECSNCGKYMIKQGTGIALMSYPAQYPQEYRCMCGHREDAGVIVGETRESSFKEKWEEINP